VHSPLVAGNAVELAIVSAAVMMVLARLTAIAAPLMRGYRALSTLLSMSAKVDEGTNYRILSSRRFFAFTAGLFRPRVYISSRLSEELEHDEFQAVLLHENGHQTRRDGLRKLSAQLLSFAHFPGMRRLLLLELALAIEQSCDEYAAHSLNDRLTVAATIVKLSRLSSLPQVHDDVVAAFDASDSERRVAGLLNPPIPRHGFLSATGFVLLLALSISGFVTAEFWHHGAESLFGAHFG
jgi:beta-lactamase regulating signal transducer with metallopeptidase domain